MRKKLAKWIGATLLMAGLAGAIGPSAAQNRDDELPADLLTVMRNSQPSFMVRVSVDKPSCTYREGDNLSIRVASEEDAYVYVMYQPSEGKTYQIFPNKFQPNNRVKAREAVKIPADDDFFRWVVSEPFGEEKIKVIATKKKIESLSSPELTKGRFNQVDPSVLKGMELELGDEPPTEWAEDDVVVHTYAADKSPELARSRRFGVFFGVSKHVFASYIRAAKKIAPDDEALKKMPATGYDLFACHRDAQKLAAAMQENGRLEAARVFTNERATRQAMEEALTQWLPKVSRPGDTVFIYFSGHTGQFEDASGDEPDGKDEFMMMHDSVSGNEVYACKKLLENKQQVIDQGLLGENDLRLAEQVANAGMAVEQQTGSLGRLIEVSAVTDETLAHWLQRLAGRQIVLICDSCNSAGYAEDEQQATLASGNDIMKNEIDRLQNLGQADQALFCSAHVGQSASERLDKSMGVMTYYIVEQLSGSPKAVRLEDTFEYCKTNVEKYYSEWNAQLDKAEAAGEIPADFGRVGAQPFLFNNCRLPIFIKP
jgi:hypothetical protein